MFYSVYDILIDRSKGKEIQIDKALKANGFTKNEIDVLKKILTYPTICNYKIKFCGFLVYQN